MSWLYFILATLSVWRLTYDFINLDGPLFAYRPLKLFIESKRERWPAYVVDGFSCYHCVSWWAGFLVCLVVPGLDWRTYLLFAVGSSGAVTLFARYNKSMYGANLFDA